MKREYASPAVASVSLVEFETLISGKSDNDFPGLGLGVGGVPGQSEGQFPGNGNHNGQQGGNNQQHKNK